VRRSANVGPLHEIGHAAVDFVAAALELLRPCLLDLVRGEAAVGAVRELRDEQLSLAPCSTRMGPGPAAGEHDELPGEI
jgi:hypothetical protein